MGLPFYRNPDDIDAENAAAKLERAAAQRRSAIRREPSIRPGREQSSSTGLTNIIRNRHEMSSRQARVRANYERQEADAQIAVLEEELNRLRRQRQRTSNRVHEERAQRRLERQAGHDLNSSLDSPVPNDVYLTRTENELSPHSPPGADHALLPRPTTESNLRFAMAANDSIRPTSFHQRSSFLPSPPHSLSDTSRNRPVDGPLDTWETSPPLTQDFAPARAARARGDSSNSTHVTTDTTRQALSDRQGLETPPPESWENSYPPLRRVPHMSPRPLPRATVDGLGDRYRSPSPLSANHEEETWNTLLTTLDNTNTASSTSTSFASMTDLLSTSRTSSHRSSNIQSTSTSFGEIGTSTEDACDLPPGITEDDVRRIRNRHRRTAGRVSAPRRRIPEPDHMISPDAEQSQDSRSTFSPMSILLHEARELREAQDSRDIQRRRDELFMLQAIAERQQSHEQVPDEWWALAGLPSGLARHQNNL